MRPSCSLCTTPSDGTFLNDCYTPAVCPLAFLVSGCSLTVCVQSPKAHLLDSVCKWLQLSVPLSNFEVIHVSMPLQWNSFNLSIGLLSDLVQNSQFADHSVRRSDPQVGDALTVLVEALSVSPTVGAQLCDIGFLKRVLPLLFDLPRDCTLRLVITRVLTMRVLTVQPICSTDWSAASAYVHIACRPGMWCRRCKYWWPGSSGRCPTCTPSCCWPWPPS
jgi:hypothetical protein